MGISNNTHLPTWFRITETRLPKGREELNMDQMGFFDVENRYAALDAKNDPLVKINAVVPWGAFRYEDEE